MCGNLLYEYNRNKCANYCGDCCGAAGANTYEDYGHERPSKYADGICKPSEDWRRFVALARVVPNAFP